MHRVVPLLVTLLLLAACGSDDAPSATPEVDGSTADSATATTDAATTDGAPSDEEAAFAFAACMRDEGIPFDDPTVAADGSIDLTAASVVANGDVSMDEAMAAWSVCRDELAGTSLLPDQDDLVENEDKLLELAQCLRDHGVDADDPDLGSLEGGSGNPFGDGFDPADPATRDAIAACRSVMATAGTDR